MDPFFAAFVGFLQLVLAGMGVYVSLRQPKQEHHRYWIGAFISVGLLGVALTWWQAQRASNAQDRANDKIGQAVTAATNANAAATNANNSVLVAQKEVKSARDEAKAAKDELARLINKSSKQTATAILNLGAETKSSIKAIAVGTPPRRIPSDSRTQLIRLFSGKPARVRISAIPNDAEAFRFAQDWYEVLKASGWTIQGNRIGTANPITDPPLFGIVVKLHGEPLAPGQNFQVPNNEPIGYIARAADALGVAISGERLLDIEEGLILLEFHTRPPRD